jgi:UDP-N-acetylglucosamine 2-epimerase (non-hydrolysing)
MAPLLHLVAAARPNLPKLSVLWAALAARPGLAQVRLVHTGQHHDSAMFGDHLADLGLPEPHHALGVAGGGHAELTGRTMLACEQLWQRERPALVVVVGDVDGTLAATLAARKLAIPVVHLEAGLRGGHPDMAEEINRRAVDAVASLLWPPSLGAAETLLREGHAPARVVAVGNTMAASLLAALPATRARPLPAGLVAGDYGVLTLHRAENVDAPARLAAWLDVVAQAARRLPLAWPLHPRTAKRMAEARLAMPADVLVLPPLGYLDFLGLLARARLVASDSGGIQEEATMLDLPCLTLRDTTERPETLGGSRLVAPGALVGAVGEVLAGGWPHAVRPPLWDDQVGARMVASLEAFLAELR